MRLKHLIVYTLFLCPLSAFGVTTVVGHIVKLDTTTPGITSYVRFWLRGVRGNQPRITGTGAIAPQFSGSTFYVDLPADASGNISGTIYSTRDSTGTGAGDIEAGGSYTAVYYGMQIVNGGIPGPEIPVHARSGGTLDIANVSAVSTLPVVTAPTGDTTYARLDGGNTPFSGAVSFGSTINATHGGSVGGTFTGNPIFSGNLTLQNLIGTTTFTNSGVFTNGVMNQSFYSTVNGASALSEFHTLFNPAQTTTSAISAALSVPSSSSVQQANGIESYVIDNRTNPVTPTVAIFGAGRAAAAGARTWGGNFVGSDQGSLSATTNLYGEESDCFVSIVGTLCTAHLAEAFWLGGIQPTNSIAYRVGQPQGAVANAHWNYGFRCDQNATITPDSNDACLYMFPVASGNSQNSQGLTFVSTTSGGTNPIGAFYQLPTGDLQFSSTVPAANLKVNSNNVTQDTATGSATVDLASVASGACTADSSDVTLTGAAVGDPVRVSAATALPAGVWLIGRVTASNTGRFQLCNLSGGAVDRASDTYTISVVK